MELNQLINCDFVVFFFVSVRKSELFIFPKCEDTEMST